MPMYPVMLPLGHRVCENKQGWRPGWSLVFSLVTVVMVDHTVSDVNVAPVASERRPWYWSKRLHSPGTGATQEHVLSESRHLCTMVTADVDVQEFR